LKQLTQATYLGGTGGDSVRSMVVSGEKVYVAGDTSSTDFPGTDGGAQVAFGGNEDAFVSILSADLKQIIQSTYLGGNDRDDADSIVVSGRNVYVTGYTSSTDFPGTDGSAQPGYGGGNEDAFVALLSADLKQLTQATYLGGTGRDQAKSVSISKGKVYVTGYTSSTDFPGTDGGAQPVHAKDYGNYDAFVALLTADLKSLIQSTYLGGGTYDYGLSMVVSGGKVYVTGYTDSTDFPGTSEGAQPVSGGGYSDAFVVLLSADLKELTQATYLGGTGYEYANSIAVSGEKVYVAGVTRSTDFPFTAGGAQPVHGGGFYGNAFVSLLTGDLKAVLAIDIDIRPWSKRNPINYKGHGVLPVAILSTEDFDAPSQVDQASLTFGATGNEKSLAFCNRRPRDVSRDGSKDDLVCHFYIELAGFKCGDTEGILMGKTVSGIPIEGEDLVRIISCK
jgi:hypothetical protein